MRDKEPEEKGKEALGQEGCTKSPQNSLQTAPRIPKIGGIWAKPSLLSVKLKPIPRRLEEFMAQILGKGGNVMDEPLPVTHSGDSSEQSRGQE